MSYINFPIPVDYEDVYNDGVLYMQSKFPGWQPNTPSLDVAILQAWATEAAQLRELTSSVTQAIFRWFGASLMNLPPIDAQPASTLTTWNMIDNNGYTIPAGTQVIITDSGVDYGFETVADYIVVAGGSVAANVPIVAIIPGADASGIGSVGGAVQLYDPLSFVADGGITMVSPTADGVDAEDDSTYLNRLREELTLMSPRLILPKDFSIDAKQIAGVFRALAVDGYNPFHNLLNLNDGSVETSIAGYTNLANATLAQSAAQAADGTKSMSMTAIAAADMSAVLVQADQVAVTPDDILTAIAFFHANTTGRPCLVGIRWYTAGNAFISEVDGLTVNDTNAAWIEAHITAQAPATAAFARILVYVVGPALGEVHYVDKMSIRRGSGTDWVAGGTGETNQPKTIAEAAIDLNGNPVDAGTKAAVLARQLALREVNFVIYMIDATQQGIDVTFTVVAQPGVDHAALLADVEAAVSAILNPSTWGTDQTVQGDAQSRTWVTSNVVRYLDIATAIRTTQGVAYISLLQIGVAGGALGTADVNLPGPAPLATVGTMIGAVAA